MQINTKQIKAIMKTLKTVQPHKTSQLEDLVFILTNRLHFLNADRIRLSKKNKAIDKDLSYYRYAGLCLLSLVLLQVVVVVFLVI